MPFLMPGRAGRVLVALHGLVGFPRDDDVVFE